MYDKQCVEYRRSRQAQPADRQRQLAQLLASKTATDEKAHHTIIQYILLTGHVGDTPSHCGMTMQPGMPLLTLTPQIVPAGNTFFARGSPPNENQQLAVETYTIRRALWRHTIAVLGCVAVASEHAARRAGAHWHVGRALCCHAVARAWCIACATRSTTHNTSVDECAHASATWRRITLRARYQMVRSTRQDSLVHPYRQRHFRTCYQAEAWVAASGTASARRLSSLATQVSARQLPDDICHSRGVGTGVGVGIGVSARVASVVVVGVGFGALVATGLVVVVRGVGMVGGGTGVGCDKRT